MLEQSEIKQLIEKAYEARKFAYMPYSNFPVGAALLCKDGTIYTGCNVENAAFTPGNCAERTAIFKAVSEGHKEYTAIAVVGGKGLTSPCGVCRQVLREFVTEPAKFWVIMVDNMMSENDTKLKYDYDILTLEELLPFSFGPANLKK